MTTNSCQMLWIICLQLTSSFSAAITSVRSVPQDILFSAGFVLDLCFLQWVLKLNTSIKFLFILECQLSASWIWMWYKDAFVLFMEIPLFLMYLALWQEAFQVRGWTLLFRLIYGLLSAVSYHLFRKKCNSLISQPRAKQASVRILKIYVNVQHSFTWGSKVTCQSRQLFAFANCFSSGFVTHRVFLSWCPCDRSSGFCHNWSFFMFQGVLTLVEGVFPQIQ